MIQTKIHGSKRRLHAVCVPARDLCCRKVHVLQNTLSPKPAGLLEKMLARKKEKKKNSISVAWIEIKIVYFVGLVTSPLKILQILVRTLIFVLHPLHITSLLGFRRLPLSRRRALIS